MNTLELFKNYRLIALLLAAITISSCSDDDDVPPAENDEEVITDVTLVFTNDANSMDVVRATAQDPDGFGAMPLEVQMEPIVLSANTSYTLTYEIFNNLETPGEDIGEEILDEDDEHQFFFSFTADAFTSPAGNGNVDNAADPLNYDDMDENNNPVGLSTSWATGAGVTGGMFTVRLQHQPDIKTGDTGANDGENDFNLTFNLEIQ